MKKLFLLTTVLCCIMINCKKDDNKSKLDERLVGTIWCSTDFAYQLLNGGNCFQCYHFYSTTEFENWRERNGQRVTTFNSGTYTLNYPNLKLSDGTGECTLTSPTRFQRNIWTSGNNESLSVYYKR